MKHDQLVFHTDTEPNVLKEVNSFYANVPPKISWLMSFPTVLLLCDILASEDGLIIV